MTLDIKFFSIGILLLAIGILSIYGYFVYPEYLVWVGIGGLLTLLFPFIAVLLGIGFIYGSFSKEEVPPLAPQTDSLIDERIDIEGAHRVAQETHICKQHFVPREKLLAIIVGEVEGNPELDRLALTDRRIIIYSSTRLKDVLTFGYGQVENVEGNKGKVLTHLGEINLFAEGAKVRFKNILEEYVGQILDTISKKKQD